MKPKIYLAGRISGISYGEATFWRKDFRSRSSGIFECLSPVRGKKTSSVFDDPKMIVLRDLTDIERSDALVVYSDIGHHPGRASYMEVGYAMGQRKPVIIIADPGDVIIRKNNFLQELPKVVFVPSIKVAVYVLCSLFNVGEE